MDPRRFLIPVACGLALSSCALWRGPPPATPPIALEASSGARPFEAPRDSEPAVEVGPVAATQAPAPEPAPPVESVTAIAWAGPVTADRTSSTRTGRDAIAAANRSARAASTSDDFVGGVQVFAWSPGRVFEIWAAPLRVTTLTLGVGETLLSKAAGDTVRWQIGEATSGDGATARTHVMLKPLERGLETNLILTTNRRVYLIDLKSGSAEAFNAAVAWDQAEPPVLAGAEDDPAPVEEVRVPDPVVLPQGDLDGRYRIEPQGRRARWTPTAVFNDGVRTFITFDPDLQVDEAPALFLIAPDGEAQMVNYRQVGGLFIVDRVFDRAELRLGDRRPQVVRIRHLSGDRS